MVDLVGKQLSVLSTSKLLGYVRGTWPSCGSGTKKSSSTVLSYTIGISSNNVMMSFSMTAVVDKPIKSTDFLVGKEEANGILVSNFLLIWSKARARAIIFACVLVRLEACFCGQLIFFLRVASF